MTTPSDGDRRPLACPVYHGAPPFSTGERGEIAWRDIEELLDGGTPTDPAVVVADASMRDRIDALRHLPRHVVIVAGDVATEKRLGRGSHISMVGVVGEPARFGVLQAACELACARHTAVHRWRHMVRRNRELDELIRIGAALMHEHDRGALLHKILMVGKRFTESDAGALVLLERRGGEPPILRLMLHEFDSLPDQPGIGDNVIAVDSSTIIGHAAVTGRALVIADAYDLPDNIGFQSGKEFDERFGYRRRSMLVVPMVDQLGHTVGVLLFVNRKTKREAMIRTKEDADRYVISYTARETRLAKALAGQAAVSIENAHLYSQIERTLESFVKAAVSAVDQRDPTTSGHSVRVAALATGLAAAADRADRGAFRNVHFTPKQMRELRFAALLHDFGKVSVRDEVLMKAKKLPPLLWERVSNRFDLIHRTLEVDHCKARERLASAGNGRDDATRVDAEFAEQLAQLARLRRVVAAANEPAIGDEPPLPELAEFARRHFTLPDGTTVPYLTEEEVHYLRIRHGTLDDDERAEVEAHVSETYRFLSRIPWTDDLKNLAPYAYGHHEKLTGGGYPRGLRGDQISIQTRMITIADMFDALTEADRPYKPAVPVEKAISILESEAKAGRLDSNLVRLMADAKPYERVLGADWHLL